MARNAQSLPTGHAVAVDMGASHLRWVLADAEARVLDEARETVRSDGRAEAVVEQIREGIARLLRQPLAGELLGVAIGVPGGVDPRSGKVIDANNVPGWREVDMGLELEQRFQCPVYLDNDVNMAALGEHWRGIAQGVDDFVFVAPGTGIGSGIFLDGRLRRGHGGFAGELFRMNLEWGRWEEEFPDSGYLEAHVSGVGLASEGRKLLRGDNGATPLSAEAKRDARFVFEAFRQGDPAAQGLIKKSFTMLGVAVANVVSVLDPELVVFNGGLVRGAPEFLLETVKKVVDRIHPKTPRIELSALGDKAQIWGALATVLEPGGAIRAGQARMSQQEK
ncbi:MAG TPA: ROK family protein [Terriglobales bacterium]|nr:ROK family protein [Terriglobales bacterium]